MRRPTLVYGLLPLLVLALAGLVPSTAAQEEDKTESRMQAVLRVKGTYLPEGGFSVSKVTPDGPGARLHRPGGSGRSTLKPGDVITAIEGRTFNGRREFRDLLNQALRASARIRISVKDATSDETVVWAVTPDVVSVAIPSREAKDDKRRLPALVPLGDLPPKLTLPPDLVKKQPAGK